MKNPVNNIFKSSSTLSFDDLTSLINFRRILHVNAEPSGREHKTAHLIDTFLSRYSPDEIIKDVGGRGLLAVFNGDQKGPTVLIRADMDGLPIAEEIEIEGEISKIKTSHRCGHDGHMAILLGVASILGKKRPPTGRVVLLFQPAEETGEGAARILKSRIFKEKISPDYAFALHNLPGFPVGQIVVKEGIFASASKGMIIEMQGATSHASQPQNGISPALAASQIIQALSSVRQFKTGLDDAALVTVIHACLGEPHAFGTSPGDAVVKATLRSHDNEIMNELENQCSFLANNIGNAYGLKTTIGWTQEFPSTNNSDIAVKIVKEAAGILDLDINIPSSPFPWSEDFGHFTNQFKGALFGLGAGTEHRDLHNPEYEFPDDIIPMGVSIFEKIIRIILKSKSNV